MSDLIRRDDALRNIEEWYAKICKPETITELGNILAGFQAYKDIAKMPAVDAEPVRHGEWVLVNATSYADVYTCSECGGFAPSGFVKSNYCPKCGAKMRGKTE